MAKVILWFNAAFGCAKLIIDEFRDIETDYFTKMLIVSCLGILAMCESIERRK